MASITPNSPPHTPQSSPKRREYDSIKRTRFFHAWDTREKGVSLREICRQSQINVPHQTGSYWLRQRDIQGSPAIRRTRKQSTRLGRPRKLKIESLQSLLSPTHPSHSLPYPSQIEAEDLSVHPHTLQQNFTKRLGAKRYKKRRTTAISPINKRDRVKYGEIHKNHNITHFWQYVYFTDECYFNSKDLATKQEYELRQPGVRARDLQENAVSPLNVTVHVAAGISYNYKGVFQFYKDPPERRIQGDPIKPRRSRFQSEDQYLTELRAWEALRADTDPIPGGNSMNQLFYTRHVLVHHINHIQSIKKRLNHEIYF
jgi:hypothetical protein